MAKRSPPIAVRDWFHQTERSIRRNRSVNRAAAAFQNVDADLRGQRHARANHAMSRQHFRARGEILSGDPIDLSVELKGERKEKRSGGRSKTNKHGHGRRLRRLLREENHALTRAHPDLVRRRARDTFAWPGWISRKRMAKQGNKELMDHLQLGQGGAVFSDKKWQLSAPSTRIALWLLMPASVKDPKMFKRVPLTKEEKRELFDRLWEQELAKGWRPEHEEPSAALGKSKAAKKPKYCKNLHPKTRDANARAEIKARVWNSFDTLIAEGK